MGYLLTWITDDLAVGYAPMSYADLDSICKQGINAIVNLCGEFCDLHEIEEKSGFEVYYLPIPDECAPDMEELEKGLAWLDEAIYLGKKVLVHCRHGIGRTGTFVTSYLLRRGLGMKLAQKKIKHTRAKPTNFSQWWLLKKYGKKSGTLKIREPSLESRNVVDLGPFYAEYEGLLQELDQRIQDAAKGSAVKSCGRDTDRCCYGYFEIQLIEAIYLGNQMNRNLSSDARQEVIHIAVERARKIRGLKREKASQRPSPDANPVRFADLYQNAKLLCPLNQDGACLLYDHRPVRCRLAHLPEDVKENIQYDEALFGLSQSVFLAFSGQFLENNLLRFSIADTVSGKFVQTYFSYLLSLTTGGTSVCKLPEQIS
jgi:protein-tyrosine phosphatase